MFIPSVGRARRSVPAITRARRFAPLPALLWIIVMTSPAQATEPVLLHAAGSLRGALADVAQAFETSSGNRVQQKYGASGTLRDAIADGERAEVFASANMAHPQSLAK